MTSTNRRDPWDEYASALYWNDQANARSTAAAALDALKDRLPGDPFADTYPADHPKPSRRRAVVTSVLMVFFLFAAAFLVTAEAQASPPAFGAVSAQIVMGPAQHVRCFHVGAVAC